MTDWESVHGRFHERFGGVRDLVSAHAEIVKHVQEDCDDMPVRKGKVGSSVLKAVDKRFTLAPWYVPGKEDAHGEWTDADELQQALWSYVRSGDRRIRLQHDTDTYAGEWVEIMSWPVEAYFTTVDGSEYWFPPGTVFLGVIWEPAIWERVLAGEIRGYSIGGQANRVMVDFDD